ncbi:hypothetical protein F4861DRAFT_521195 [Xylaria intraflava]|nr:hypothetical protein F4861DRAFT_521195 [Xylaria intraflava]
MGIKGIYKEIGPGKRVSLTKLAVQQLEESGRPLRIAIDISIWQFQAQAARGGSNPAVRTLFYRLLRLLSLSIQPIFVFDGPNKPVFKRHKRAGRGDGVATAMAKRLVRLFGCVVHDAPGEAEAECALLQQSRIVDAVLSEDVDTIMFGCTRTLRNWSSEGTKGNKTPTHVSMYDSQDLYQGTSGLDREGMVLVALMSGGDYLPEGIPGAGVKLACEAARAGFGKSLCKLKRSNTSELASWKEWLSYELRHNESGFFRTRHKALTIPEDFPNMEILRYYTHPVVSSAATLDRLRKQTWDKNIDVEGLREFARETFDWSYRIGAIKYIRVLAPCLLMRKLMQRNTRQNNTHRDVDAMGKEEGELVKSITSRRAHFSTDATPELRISFIPNNIVGYDFEQEPDEVLDFGRDGLALNSDDEMGDPAEDEGEADSSGKSKAKKSYSPTEADLLWIPETVAKKGIPLMVENWEEAQQAKAAARSKPKTSKQKSKTGGMASGALDKFVKVTKNNVLQTTVPEKSKRLTSGRQLSPARAFIPPEDLPLYSQSDSPLLPSSRGPQKSSTSRPTSKPTPKSRSRKKSLETPKMSANVNPWTIAGSPYSPRVTKTRSSTKASQPILISSSPPSSPPKDSSPLARKTRSSYERDKLRSITTESSSQQEKFSSPSTRPVIDVDEAEVSPVNKLNPTSVPSKKLPRTLARTESLPLESTPPRRQTRGFARAQTLAVETPQKGDHSSDRDSDCDSDELELPSLDNLIAQSKRGKEVMGSSKVSASNGQQKGAGGTEKETQTMKQQPPRRTKLFMSRKSEQGFFREVDVSVEEAEAALAAARQEAAAIPKGTRRPPGVWRRSDISVVDLTGAD